MLIYCRIDPLFPPQDALFRGGILLLTHRSRREHPITRHTIELIRYALIDHEFVAGQGLITGLIHLFLLRTMASECE